MTDEHTTAPGHIERPPRSMETVEEREVEPGQDYPSSGDVGYSPGGAPHADEDVVAVRVVNAPSPPETITEWQAFPVFVSTSAVEIVGANRNRSRAFIRNANASGGNECYLLPSGSTPREFGYMLEAQDAAEFFHNQAVWAQCATGESATLYVFVEYVVE